MVKKRLGRPPKKQAERKDVDLRIPVTADQKALIMRAARIEGTDMAAWVRPIVLLAAELAVDDNSGTRRGALFSAEFLRHLKTMWPQGRGT
jgi:uncharacterized protein (DUF1778 family)